MAENKNAFLMYRDLIHTVNKLPDDKAGLLFKTILSYVNDQDPVVNDLVVDIVFEPIKQQMKRDLKSWEKKVGKSSDNGMLGNLKRWHPDLFKKVDKGLLTLEEAEKEVVSRKSSGSDKGDKNHRHPIKSVANVGDTVTVTDTVTDTIEANASVADESASDDSKPKSLGKQYKDLVKEMDGKDELTVAIALRDFVRDKRPDFIEPYQELWNMMARKYKLPAVVVLNDARKRKFKTRIAEAPFDFPKILEKISRSNRMRGIDSEWKVTFDWVMENQTNYARILEGNYDN